MIKKFKKKKVAFYLYGKMRIGTVIDERDSNDQDRDWIEYKINYKWYRKPIWVAWWFVWDGTRLNKKLWS